MTAETVYITKYALTTGIIMGMSEDPKAKYPSVRWYMSKDTVHRRDVFSRAYVHATLEAAQQHAESMRQERIKSLTKSLAQVTMRTIKVVDGRAPKP